MTRSKDYSTSSNSEYSYFVLELSEVVTKSCNVLSAGGFFTFHSPRGNNWRMCAVNSIIGLMEANSGWPFGKPKRIGAVRLARTKCRKS